MEIIKEEKLKPVYRLEGKMGTIIKVDLNKDKDRQVFFSGAFVTMKELEELSEKLEELFDTIEEE